MKTENTNSSTQQTEKQKQFESGVPFRIGTERTSSKRYMCHNKLNIIVDSDDNRIGEVLEVGAYHAKIKHDFLGIPLATYVRFENIIFDKP